MSVNSTTFGGFVAADPKTSFSEKRNSLIAKFSVYNTEYIAGRKEVNHLQVRAYGPLAETVSQYCGKGKQVVCSGRMCSYTWTNEQGEKVTIYYLKLSSIDLLGEKRIPLTAQEAASIA